MYTNHYKVNHNMEVKNFCVFLFLYPLAWLTSQISLIKFRA